MWGVTDRTVQSCIHDPCLPHRSTDEQCNGVRESTMYNCSGMHGGNLDYDACVEASRNVIHVWPRFYKNELMPSCYRRIMKISWTDKMRNDDVLKMVKKDCLQCRRRIV